jgi:hypothetical protein
MIHPYFQKVSTKVSLADFAEDSLKLPRRAAHVLGDGGEGQVKLAVALSDDLFRPCQERSPPPVGLSPRHP